jgi:hypothetical protein
MKNFPARKGDKKNSEYFEQTLPQILERREKAGLDDLITRMRGIVIQVDTHDAGPYMAELYLMTPYRFRTMYQNESHNIYILAIKDEYPTMFIIEPVNPEYTDDIARVNMLYARAKAKKNAKYIGEIYHTNNKEETVKILTDQQFRFQNPQENSNRFIANPNFAFTEVSYYTGNFVGYSGNDLIEATSLGLGEKKELPAEIKTLLEKSDEVQRKFGLFDLINGIDHLATRVLSGDREDAILEILCLTNHYFWGAYTIDDMNSSTNITRNPTITNELHSPAKVFTANNNPFYTNTIVDLPSPTEDFVRNFGKRMHHMAYEVEDGAQENGMKNIDYVVNKLIDSDIKFLEQIIGECTDFPDLKQIFSKSSNYSFLITEYVQRCHGFDGFFTKTNVAFLTKAAGLDERLEVGKHD